MFRVTGRGAETVFKNEPGGHRWQRVPPTEKKGRVQTSTVTVAVLREPTPCSRPALSDISRDGSSDQTSDVPRQIFYEASS